MARNVLVTGSSGFFGAALVRALAAHPFVRRVVGVDSRPPAGELVSKFKHYPSDIRDEVYLRAILEQEEIEVVYHLAFLMGELPQRVVAHSLNVDGTAAVVEAANKAARVQKLVVASSALAYGARRSNPLYLKEDAPLRADGLAYAFWKRRMELEIDKLKPELRPQLQVAILRICTMVGARRRIAGPVRPFLESAVSLSVLWRDCPMQFIAQEDLLRVFTRILEVPEFRGVFNVAPNDHTTLKTLCRRLGRPHVALPYSLVWLSLMLAKRLKPSWGFSEGAAPYLAHPIVLDNSKIKRALGIDFSVGSEASLLGAAPAAPEPPPAALPASRDKPGPSAQILESRKTHPL